MNSPIEELEKAIVQRLVVTLTLPGQAWPKVEVLAWPNRPREYKMTHPHGCVMVIYKGSRYSDDASTSGHFVERDALFELGIISRTLREANVPDAANDGRGIYELLHSCSNALLGWQPEQARSIVCLRSEEFDDYVEGTWGYSLQFVVPMITVVQRMCPGGEPGPLAEFDFVTA